VYKLDNHSRRLRNCSYSLSSTSWALV
jgi:hypothetical protein